MPFLLDSPVFEDGHAIPPKYARAHANVSPPLAWRDVPAGTKSLALIVEDPDAPNGTFHHWALYNIGASETSLPEGVKDGSAVNDFGNARYDGPQPPQGDPAHHYHFRLFALDVARLDLPVTAKVPEVLQAAREHKIGEAELVGTFQS